MWLTFCHKPKPFYFKGSGIEFLM